MTTSEQAYQEETPVETPTPEQVAGVYWSLNEASRQTKMPKGTISKDAAKGKIQWHERPDGTKKLHAAEIFHYYADRIKRRAQETGNNRGNVVSLTTSEQQISQEETWKQPQKQDQNAIQLAEALLEVRHLKERLDDKSEQIEDLREQRDKLMEQNHRLTLMLPAPTPTPAAQDNTPPENPPVQRRSLWGRITGK
jgi:hypothetical protein